VTAARRIPVRYAKAAAPLDRPTRGERRERREESREKRDERDERRDERREERRDERREETREPRHFCLRVWRALKAQVSSSGISSSGSRNYAKLECERLTSSTTLL